MRSFSRSVVAGIALSSVVALQLPPAQGSPNSPRERSFRPVVPIKQNVRGGMDQMRSQTVRLTIPPPPIPDFPATVPPTLETPTEPSPAKVESQNPLPPEPRTDTAKTASREADEIKEAVETSKPVSEPAEKKDGPTLSRLREEAHLLAEKKLSYVFGAADPDSGGLDCSSTIQHLLTKIGVKGVPRTSYDQYYWLKRKKLLDDVYGKGSSSKLLKKLSPGDLIFWGGTWKSGHRVSHVMLYMGYDPAADKHYVFGARSKSVTGLTGAGVDIFELDTERGRLVAHGKIPGLIYE